MMLLKVREKLIRLLIGPRRIWWDETKDPYRKLDAGDGRPLGSLAAQSLARRLYESGQTILDAELTGFTVCGADAGDYVIRIEQTRAPSNKGPSE